MGEAAKGSDEAAQERAALDEERAFRGRSMHRAALPRRLRKVHDVPFVELYGGRLQGVVSSGSDPMRVYVAYFEAGTLNRSCSTNNNRPCGGGGLCKHLQGLMDQAVECYGPERVARYLQLPGDVAATTTARELVQRKLGSSVRSPVSSVFSRFLSYLRYVERPGTLAPTPELAWFVTG